MNIDHFILANRKMANEHNNIIEQRMGKERIYGGNTLKEKFILYIKKFDLRLEDCKIVKNGVIAVVYTDKDYKVIRDEKKLQKLREQEELFKVTYTFRIEEVHSEWVKEEKLTDSFD